jgi:hypothetical protein
LVWVSSDGQRLRSPEEVEDPTSASFRSSLQFEGECPYCEDGILYVGGGIDEEGATEPAIFHSMPSCPTYETTDLLATLTHFRKKRDAGVILVREVKR